ncbi:hypothetical protein TPAU25S_00948 [Tsukamurella paurometabola]
MFCTTAKTITSRRTSGVQIFTRRTAVRSGVCGGGGVSVSSASRSSGGLGGSGCCVVRSSPTCGSEVVASAGGTVRDAVVASAAGGGLRTAGSSKSFSATNLLVRSASVSGLGSVPAPASPSLSMVVGWSTAGFRCRKTAVG